MANNKIRTNTHTVMPFEKASEAHKLMESALHRGKILLVPGLQTRSRAVVDACWMKGYTVLILFAGFSVNRKM